MEFDLKKTLLALLVSTNEPLSIKDIQAVVTRYHEQRDEDIADDDEAEGGANDDGAGQGIMRDLLDQVPSLLTSAQIRDAMDGISADFIENDSIMRLSEGPNGYRLAVSAQYADWVRLLRDEPRPQKLRPAVLETLAIIAYRQPVTRAEIEAIRGVSADGPLNKLMEKDLVFVMGRAELPGRPLQYGTTDTFLEFCGIRSLEELPASDVLSPNQINEWIRSATQPEEPIEDEAVGLPKADLGDSKPEENSAEEEQETLEGETETEDELSEKDDL